MKSATSSQRLTLLVLRDAQHGVKQIQLSKPVLMAVPAIAILSLSGLIVSMQIHSSQIINNLEQSIAIQNSTNMKLEMVVNDRDEAIKRLQSEILLLSNEAKDMKDQMQRVTELEEELELFIQKHTTSMSTESISTAAEPLTWEPSQPTGGEFIAVHEADLPTLTKETLDEFDELREMLSTMESHIPNTLEKAHATQKRLDGTPTAWPTSSRVLTSSFGYRSDPFNGSAAFHAGIDIAGRVGDPIYAAGAGKVIAAEKGGAKGKYVIIQHPGGLQTWYMHLNSYNVSSGEEVTKGAVIGTLGSTGRSTGPHLHFQVLKQNQTVNPLAYVK